MSISKGFITTLLIALLAGSVAQARNLPPLASSGQTVQPDVQDVQIIIQSHQVRIAARSSVVEMQLQVFDQAGALVYDSGPLSGSELSWALHNASGEAIPSGLYAYKLSVKEANAETPALRRGHLIVERGRDRDPQTDRVWVTSRGPVGAEAALSGGEMTVSTGPETNVVGARIGISLSERGRLRRDAQGRLIAEQGDQTVGAKEGLALAPNISGTGTTNRITKWTDGPNGVVGDSTLTEVGGNIGIGTTSPITGLDYRHTLAPFLTRDIGTTNFGTPQSAIQIGVTGTGSRNVGVGPSFLFFSDDSAGQKKFLGRLSAGWENPTNGQETGFVSFNVRANSADIGALTERMRITSAGTVAIGTTTPFAGNKLDVNGSALFRTGGSGGGFISLHTPNAETGLTINGNGTTRADLRFNGSTLKLVASDAGIPPATNGIAITTNGNVGIGTDNPGIGRLHVEGGNQTGMYGTSNNFYGVFGSSTSFIGVAGSSYSGSGVSGFSNNGYGVSGSSSNGYAGFFEGKVKVNGMLEKTGGAFKIDHPLDPENKYLFHSFVESPDMKNLYDGAVTTDANGEAEITLPDWFAALNRDFRYQLTCIGVFAQAIIAEEIKDNRFKIRTSLPQVKVSWQVTGTRQDAWANQNRLPVEELKPEVERGSYQNPTAFGQPEEKSIEWARNPARMKQQKEQLERWQREQNNKDAAPAARPNNR